MKYSFLISVCTIITTFLFSIGFQTSAIGCPSRKWHSPIKNPLWKEIPNKPLETIRTKPEKERYINDLENFKNFEIDEFRFKLEISRYYNEYVRRLVDICQIEAKIDMNRYEALLNEYDVQFNLYKQKMRIHNKLVIECEKRIQRARTYTLPLPH